jgi:3-isopropylmalate dehydrogenase
LIPGDETGQSCFSIKKVLKQGYRTVDIAKEGDKTVGTTEMGELISKSL